MVTSGLNIHFNNILPSMPKSLKWFKALSTIANEKLVYFLHDVPICF
jgi:hypothetical protein